MDSKFCYLSNIRRLISSKVNYRTSLLQTKASVNRGFAIVGIKKTITQFQVTCQNQNGL